MGLGDYFGGEESPEEEEARKNVIRQQYQAELQKAETPEQAEEIWARQDADLGIERDYSMGDYAKWAVRAPLEYMTDVPFTEETRLATEADMLNRGVVAPKEGFRWGDTAVPLKEDANPESLRRLGFEDRPPLEESQALQILESLPVDLSGKEIGDDQLEATLEEATDTQDPKSLYNKKERAFEYEGKSATFGLRMDQAHKGLDLLEQSYELNTTPAAIQNYDVNIPLPFTDGKGGIELSAVPNSRRSGVMQKKEQHERNFVNALLRRESGAVISATEFSEASKQYFVQWGDTPEVVQQKRRNRSRVTAALLMEGRGFDQKQLTQQASTEINENVVKLGGVVIPETGKVVLPTAEGKWKVVKSIDFYLQGIDKGLYNSDPGTYEKLKSMSRYSPEELELGRKQLEEMRARMRAAKEKQGPEVEDQPDPTQSQPPIPGGQ